MFHALTCLEGNSDHVLVGHSYFAVIIIGIFFLCVVPVVLELSM